MAKPFSHHELNFLQHNSPYNEENKAAYLKMGKSILKKLALAMRLQKGEYSVRLCEGGIAVPGEIILHTDHLYLQICNCWGRPGATIMYRSCKGPRDYHGGPNHWASVESLDNLDDFAETLLNFIERSTRLAAA